MKFTYIVHLIKGEGNDISAMNLSPAGRVFFFWILSLVMSAWQLLRSMRIVSAAVPKWCNTDIVRILCAE